ncbi:MAG: MMPL family transporter [Clostridia bacterium]|nr:MMPL family transporter [Clostridia bacterium]
MKKISALIVKFKWLIVIFTIIIVALSSVGIVTLMRDGRINSDMISYLSDEFEMTKGLNFLRQNFGINADALVVVEGDVADEGLRQSVQRIKNFEGISQFIWVEDVEEMEGFSEYAQFLGDDVTINTDGLEAFLKHSIEGSGKYNYVLLILMDYSPSTKEANALYDDILSELGDRPYATSGMTATSKIMMEDTLRELPVYLIYAGIALVLVLLLVTKSFIEPLILLVSLGVSVLVNLGSNMVFPSISIISFALSSVLQLALTMDYAIFYMHIYRQKRLAADKIEATKKAIPSVASSIIASALTTMGGFAALFFMKFQLGADLAMVLMKGVLLSLVTVLVLQPVFVLLFDKLLLRTEHKELKLNVKPVAKLASKFGLVLIIAALAAVAPLYIGQSKLEYSYFETYSSEITTPQQQLAYELGNQMIIAVPLETKNGKSHQDFIAELSSDEKVSGVMSAFSAINISGEQMSELLDHPVYSHFFNSNMAGSYFKKVDMNGAQTWYTLYTLAIKGSTEDAAAISSYANISQIVDNYFENSYSSGMLVGVNDMKSVTPTDFLVVTLISVAVILVILMAIFRSIRKGLLLIFIIELGIWLNLTISFLFGQHLNFMIYIMISSIQLGCMVDYAILVANRFEEIKWQFTKARDAAVAATTQTFPAVAASAAVIIAACMSMYFVSDNLIIKQLTGMLARGAVISLVLILTLQTAIMPYFRRVKTYREMFAQLGYIIEKRNERIRLRISENNERTRQRIRNNNEKARARFQANNERIRQNNLRIRLNIKNNNALIRKRVRENNEKIRKFFKAAFGRNT